jgi:hypothetical protein
MTLFVLTPNLTTMKGLRRREGSKQSEGIDPRMSPLEAANVTMSLAFQKLFNGQYQKVPKERNSRTSIRQAPGDQGESVEGTSPRTKEMLTIVQKGSIPLILPDRSKRFAHRSLDRLGIPR